MENPEENPDIKEDREDEEDISVTIADVDEYAASEQHIRCGRPFDEPVRTPEWISKMYTGPMGNMNYPIDMIQERQKHVRDKWEKNSVKAYGKKSRDLFRKMPIDTSKAQVVIPKDKGEMNAKEKAKSLMQKRKRN